MSDSECASIRTRKAGSAQSIRFSNDKHDDTAWPAVKGYMRQHDDDVTGNYSDDINTILVLDGLFSAFVTAFSLPAYTSLQEDNTQTSAALLADISAQLRSYHSNPPFVNSTFTPVVSTPFQPPLFARWVSALWFLSLIISLVSALLGILAKQWIREYLTWDKTTALPKNNIRVRQVRFEAWADWHTPTIISAIPVLLELAIVLFVIGLIIFTWNQDVALGIVVAIAVAIFLSLVIALTALPLFFKSCPFKSPTAKACIVATYWARIRSRFLLRLCVACIQRSSWSFREYTIKLREVFRLELETFHRATACKIGWRERDLEGGMIQKLLNLWGRMTAASEVALDELITEMSNSLCTDMVSIYRDAYADGSLPDADEIMDQITEFELLFRAFSWTLDEASDPSLAQQVSRCVGSLFVPNMAEFDPQYGGALHDALTKSSYLHGVKTSAVWYLASRAYAPGNAPWPSLSDPALLQPPMQARETITTYVRGLIEPFYTSGSTEEPMVIEIYYRDLLTVQVGEDLTLDNRLAATDKSILGLFIASQIHILIKDMLVFVASVVGELESGHFDDQALNSQLNLFRHRLAGPLCALLSFVIGRWNSDANRKPTSEAEYAYLEILLDAWCMIYHHPQKSIFDSKFPGARLSILDVVFFRTLFSLVPVNSHERKVEWQRVLPGEYLSVWPTFARDYPLDDNSSREDLHIYSWMVSSAIQFMQTNNEPRDRLDGDCLDHMALALNICSEKALRNAGAYRSLDWLPRMIAPGGKSVPARSIHEEYPGEFFNFIAAYDSSQSLIDNAGNDLNRLRQTLGLLLLVDINTNEPPDTLSVIRRGRNEVAGYTPNHRE